MKVIYSEKDTIKKTASSPIPTSIYLQKYTVRYIPFTTIQNFNTYILHKVKYQHISKNRINNTTLITYYYSLHHSYTILSYDSKILK
ncbi:hypothetical protein J2772_004720 [Chryseobacterium jejuense]|nr:hypothetical protein [Chryseobacterium jejuense]